MEETAVSTQESVQEFTPATVFEFAPEEDSAPVDAGEAAEPAGEGAQDAPKETGDGEKQSPEGVAGPDGAKKQKDVGSAFAKEKRRVEAREKARYEEALRNDPLRKLGRLMVDDVRQGGDMTEEDAISAATENFLKAVAKRDGISPNVARKLYGAEIQKSVEQAAKAETEDPDIPDPDAEAQRIWEEVEAADKPEGFDADAAYKDREFVQLLTEMPAAAAIRVWHAERQAATAKQDIAERLLARQNIPQMTKPAQQATPKTDWTRVDRATFLAEKERRRKSR